MTRKVTTNRISSIDALRGFAILGIFIVNVFIFNAPYAHYGPFYYSFDAFQIEAMEWMVFLAVGKFMFIFAFLFGYGCWMQFKKYDSLIDFRNYWRKRMLWLAVFGLLHVLFLSMGDILLPYALLGLTLPWLLQLRNRYLLLFAFIVYSLPVLEFVVRPFLEYESWFMSSEISLEEYIRIYGEGNWWEMFKLRLQDYSSFRNEKLLMYMTKEWSLFLVGIVAARRSWATRLQNNWGWAIALFIVLLALVWADNRPAVFEALDMDKVPNRIGVGLLIQSFEFAHGLAYIIGFWSLWKFKFVQKLLGLLTYVGRMSLTNYLMQSFLCFFIFSKYGFGLYGQLNPMQLIAMAAGIFALQAVFSYWWLQRQRFGPVEGLWRKLSY